MFADEEEFVLGEDITSLARAKGRKETVVFSVRLSREEFERLDAAAQMQGKTASQIAREAIRNVVVSSNLSQQPSITVSFLGGGTTTTGGSFQTATASKTENFSDPVASHS
jgi:hypothetical protein